MNIQGLRARGNTVDLVQFAMFGPMRNTSPCISCVLREDEATPRRLLQHKHQSYPEYITVKQVRSIQAICKFAAAQLPTFKISCDLLVGGRVVHQFAHLDLKASLTAHVLLDSILLRLRQSGCFSEEEVQQLFAADLRLQ